jgi:hypothetical protein
MKKVVNFLAVFVLTFGAFASVAHAYIDHSTAVVRILNKAAGKTQTVRVPVGHSVDFEKLNIGVRTCKQTDPFDAENFFAFIEIIDSNDIQIFGGWMNRNEPGQNPLQNPDYDVWLVSCE